MKRRRWIYDVMATAGWAVIAAGIGMWSLQGGIITAGLGLLMVGVLGAWMDGGKHAE